MSHRSAREDARSARVVEARAARPNKRAGAHCRREQRPLRPIACGRDPANQKRKSRRRKRGGPVAPLGQWQWLGDMA
eukprot:7257685-Pyramimonas_sp.AAC.1